MLFLLPLPSSYRKGFDLFSRSPTYSGRSRGLPKVEPWQSPPNGDFALLACEITDLSGPTWFLLGVPSLRNDALRLQEVASWKASPFSSGNSSATFLQRFRVILGEECTKQVAHFLMFRLTAHSPQLGISGFTGMRNRGAFDACQ